MIYLLDTNVISDRISQQPGVSAKLTAALQAGDTLLLSPPVHYEVLRGLRWLNSAKKLAFYQQQFVPALGWIDTERRDVETAAELWAVTRKQGYQLADADLLLAALALRLSAVIVTADQDFAVLPVICENWR